MRASVIVPTIAARPDLLAVCCESVERTLGDLDDLLVIQGGTFAQNCNAGSLHARGDYLIFLNDDCKVDQDDWLDRLLDPFGDESVGVVGCRLIYPTGKIQHTGVYFTADDGVLTAWNRLDEAPSGPVDAVTGACLAIRADLFKELGGFDEAYRNGYEDVDLCLRVRERGIAVHYTADCTLIHHESQSGPARWQYVRQNVERLQQLWSVGP